jgi:hypothetical protein
MNTIIENIWTRGIFRTATHLHGGRNWDVVHRCVLCPFTVVSAYSNEEELDKTNGKMRAASSEIMAHELLHPEAQWICDWWRFKNKFDAAVGRLNPYYGTGVLEWKN